MANPNLSSYASSIDGDGSTLFADSLGMLSLFVQNASLLGRVTAMVVDTGGGFGGDPLAADVATDLGLRIRPGDSTSVRASNFGNFFPAIVWRPAPTAPCAWGTRDRVSPSPIPAGATLPRESPASRPITRGVNDPVRPQSPTLRVYRNPMAGAGRVSLRLEQETEAKLEMSDVRGRLEATPLAGRLEATPFAGRLEAGTMDLLIELRTAEGAAVKPQRRLSPPGARG